MSGSIPPVKCLKPKKARIAIDRRINWIESGNFGDHRFCRDRVWELRIDVGPGYRGYYAVAGSQAVLLLCGGDNGRRMQILPAPANTGGTGKEGLSDERQVT
jgi:putative addiction module killer protein